jgi:hypothetical protein
MGQLNMMKSMIHEAVDTALAGKIEETKAKRETKLF